MVWVIRLIEEGEPGDDPGAGIYIYFQLEQTVGFEYASCFGSHFCFEFGNGERIEIWLGTGSRYSTSLQVSAWY